MNSRDQLLDLESPIINHKRSAATESVPSFTASSYENIVTLVLWIALAIVVGMIAHQLFFAYKKRPGGSQASSGQSSVQILERIESRRQSRTQ